MLVSLKDAQANASAYLVKSSSCVDGASPLARAFSPVDYRRLFIVDGYSGYRVLGEPTSTLAFCQSHGARSLRSITSVVIAAVKTSPHGGRQSGPSWTAVAVTTTFSCGWDENMAQRGRSSQALTICYGTVRERVHVSVPSSRLPPGAHMPIQLSPDWV